MSYELSAHVRQEIDDWKTRFPADRQRSAVIRALHLVQHVPGVVGLARLLEAAAGVGEGAVREHIPAEHVHRAEGLGGRGVLVDHPRIAEVSLEIPIDVPKDGPGHHP